MKVEGAKPQRDHRREATRGRRHKATSKARSHKGDATKPVSGCTLSQSDSKTSGLPRRVEGRFRSVSVGFMAQGSVADGVWGRLLSRWCQFLLQSQRLRSRAASPSLWHSSRRRLLSRGRLFSRNRLCSRGLRGPVHALVGTRSRQRLCSRWLHRQEANSLGH